eukprot:6444995-Pyramimonas_sp.AAC.1
MGGEGLPRGLDFRLGWMCWIICIWLSAFHRGPNVVPCLLRSVSVEEVGCPRQQRGACAPRVGQGAERCRLTSRPARAGAAEGPIGGRGA